MKVALCAIARHENRYLKEWFDHYINMGIDHIFIGDNNDICNDESIFDFVHENGYEGYVTVIDKRRQPNQTNSLDGQCKFYEEVYHKYGHGYDWMCFFDIDEFMSILPTFVENNDIKNYIQISLDYCKNNYDKDGEQIMVGWLHYDDNDQLFYENKPVQERFTRLSERIYFDRQHRNVFCGKCIVKCGIPNVVFKDMHIARLPDTNLITLVNGGEIENNPSMAMYFLHIDAVLKHFYSKSLEEFVQRRLMDRKSYVNLNFENCMNDFFAVNKRTHNKEKLFELYKKLLESTC